MRQFFALRMTAQWDETEVVEDYGWAATGGRRSDSGGLESGFQPDSIFCACARAWVRARARACSSPHAHPVPTWAGSSGIWLLRLVMEYVFELTVQVALLDRLQ